MISPRPRTHAVDEEQVKAANRELYDAVAVNYEAVDGRRSIELEAWLRATLVALRAQAPGGALLDVGAGGGLATRCAHGVFTTRVAMDLSPRILAAHRSAFDAGVAGDVDQLPFADNSFDAVVCFAVLHHLYAFEKLVGELARVLKPGGVLYTDHDMDAAFYRRFRPLLNLYRWMRNSAAAYVRSNARVTEEMYHLSEWRQEGVEAQPLLELLGANGFAATATFHWYGLTQVTDKLFGVRRMTRGAAPLLSIRARKTQARDA